MRLTLLKHLALLSVMALVAACGSKGADAPAAIQHLTLTPIRTLGGAEDGPSSLSDLRSFVVDPEGRFFVLDASTQTVEMFDSMGTHLKTIGRKGQGPGEFARANGIVRSPDGTLWVNDYGNKRFTVLDAEGNLLRTVAVNMTSVGYIWDAWFEPDSSLYEVFSFRQDTTFTRGLQRFREGGSKVDTLPLPCDGLVPVLTPDSWFRVEFPQGFMHMAIPFNAAPIEIYDRQGHAWCGATDSYTLRRVALTTRGDTLTLTGNRTALPVSARDRDSAITAMKADIAKVNGKEPDYGRIPAIKPIIASVITDDSGRVWVSPVTADSGQVWDLFKDGKQVAEVRSPVQFAPRRPMLVQGNKVFGITRDESDVLRIVTARLSSR